MVYEWECSQCGSRVDIDRPIDKHDSPPTKRERTCKCPPKRDAFTKVYSSSSDFETMRDRGHLTRLPS